MIAEESTSDLVGYRQQEAKTDDFEAASYLISQGQKCDTGPA